MAELRLGHPGLWALGGKVSMKVLDPFSAASSFFPFLVVHKPRSQGSMDLRRFGPVFLLARGPGPEPAPDPVALGARSLGWRPRLASSTL